MISIPGYTIVKTIEEPSYLLLRAIRDKDGLRFVVKSTWLNNAAETKHLRHEFELTPQLDESWAIKPIDLEYTRDLAVLIYEDFNDITLREYTHNEPVKLNKFLTLALSITKALSKQHKQNIIHKNIKPENIFIDPRTNEIRFFDYGIASLIPSEYSKILPATDVIEGSFPYLSPEQTGRMNRSIDYRSDIYSLGITFYEILTGRLPFEAKDALEWVYSHIVKTPHPIVLFDSDIPEVVIDIIMRLIEKVPEDRYQTLEGLIYDIDRCLEQLNVNDLIEPFPLGEKDISGKLQISQKIYGREKEIGILINAYNNVLNTGVPEFILVAGYSGTGKTVLINELHNPIIKDKGFFISGKFDQYKKGTPYFTFAEAFKELVLIILSQSEEEIKEWKERILEALGVNGQVIIELIPEVELIIGKQPSINVEYSPAGNQNRFNLYFEKFVSVFSKKEHPLTIFLDDLQWADLASLSLIQQIITNPGNKYIFLVGSYRDNEVTSSHPLILTLNEIKETPSAVKEIKLSALTEVDILHFISDTLKSDPEYVMPLADLIFKKTGGNPFFTIQFLMELYKEQLLKFDSKSFKWTWKQEDINSRGYTSNIVDLMTTRIKRLSSVTQNLLSLAACIGNKFDKATLAIIAAASEEEIGQRLKDTINEGLLYSFDHTYKFLHDRIQEAAYSFIPEQSRAAKHLQIGRILLEWLTNEEKENRIFDIVNQFNLGIEEIKEPAEKELLCWLNFQAGRKAKASVAYGPARDYFEMAMKLLAPDAWSNRYEDTLILFLERCECEYMIGKFETEKNLLKIILQKAATKSDKVLAYRLKIQLFQILGRYGDALNVAFEALEMFDISFPDTDKELEEAIKAENDEIQINLHGRHISDLVDAPLATDIDKKSVIILLTEALPCAFLSEPKYWSLILIRILNVSLRYGNVNESCFAYINYGTWQVSRFGNIPLAIEYAQLALHLNSKLGDVKLKGTILFMLGSHINFWHRHLATSRPILEKALIDCLDAGDLNYASHVTYHAIFHFIEKGSSLNATLKELENYKEFLNNIRNYTIYGVIRQYEQFVKSMQGLTVELTSFNDSSFDESECLLFFKNAEFIPGILYNHILKQINNFIFCRYEEALKYSNLAASELSTMIGSLFEATQHFYHALIITVLYPNVSESTQNEFRNSLNEKIKKLKLWSDNCPENFLSRYTLVLAEVSRIEGKDMKETMSLYDKAIGSARENGFVHIEAIANELAAKFYKEKGFQRIGEIFLWEAYNSYLNWGATGKVKQLEKNYSFLKSVQQPSSKSQIDALAIIKASQVISVEVVLEKLNEALIRIIAEHAGAQKAYLLIDLGKKMTLASEAIIADSGKMCMKAHNITEFSGSKVLPESIIRYVERIQEKIILDNASAPNRFSSDKYLIVNQPKSIACLPIIRQKKLIGILYMENNLFADAFTSETISILELLASQAAISIENAILFKDLNTSKQQLQDVIDNSSAIIFIKDKVGNYLFINSQFEKLFHINREKVIGINDYEIWPKEFADKFTANDREVLETGKPFTYEDIVPKNDAFLTFITVKFPLLDASTKPYAVCGIATDITERKLAEQEIRQLNTVLEQRIVQLTLVQRELEKSNVELLKTTADLDNFVYSASHNVRGPVATLEGLVNILSMKLYKEEELEDIVKMMKKSLTKFIQTINDLAEISKVQKLMEGEDMEWINIKEVTEDIFSELKEEFKYFDAVLITDYQKVSKILFSKNNFRRILFNLINNAFRFRSPERKLKIVVKSGYIDNYTIITVSDNGIGIGKDNQDKIFSMLYRGHGHVAGKGIGLYIIKRILENEGGKIEIESKEGEGSTFTVYFKRQI